MINISRLARENWSFNPSFYNTMKEFLLGLSDSLEEFPPLHTIIQRFG